MPAKPDPVVASFVRAHATLRLITELSPEIIRASFPGRATIQILAPGGPACSIRVAGGKATFRSTRRVFPTVSLWFPKPAHVAALLAGGKAPVIPIPASPRFITGVKAFRKLTGAVQEAFQDPEHRVRLLLMGTLFALEEVASRDSYVAARARRIPDGTIAVSVEGDDEVRGWFRKGPEGITTGSGAPDSTPNAELQFADRDAAEALLAGKLPAALALAERRVRLYGRIPMIQNLFPVLDRVAVYMGGQS